MIYRFQLEVDVDRLDLVPALRHVMNHMVDSLTPLVNPERDPPIKLTVIDLGWGDPWEG